MEFSLNAIDMIKSLDEHIKSSPIIYLFNVTHSKCPQGLYVLSELFDFGLRSSLG